MRSSFILILFLIFNTCVVANPKPQPLNVILLMADDSAADNYGCYGSSYFKTPVLDHLAKTGAKFNNCYSTPGCTPSRVKL